MRGVRDRARELHGAWLNADVSIDIPRSWTNLFWGTLLALPTGLGVEISGSKEGEVLKVRKAIVGNDLTTATENVGTG